MLLILIILSIIAISGGSKKVVYLKPKSTKKSKSGKTEDEGEVENTETQQISRPPGMPPTAAPVDEGVLQSEIQTQRQSAVAMSAGQKEGATQIVKDWLDESKNDEENTEE